MAMEGNGPRGGKPRRMNVLLFSSDPVALDATVCRMMGLNPAAVPTISLGMKSGLGHYMETEIELLGDDLKQFITANFEVKRESADSTPKIPGFFTNLVVPKPFIKKEGCVKCGVCVNMCPVTPKVLNWDKGDKTKPPVYDYDRCIRCYCCQELCPESTIVVKTPLLRRGLNKIK
jgi:Pyruvate/2-oxoacid:ferredoxin oxidoreductase delta subunit